jgi:molybdate transport system substrate-binding protein
MSKCMKRVAILLAAAIILGFSEAQAEPISVFAAASMKTALDKIDAAWKSKSGQNVVATYGSTATLAKQIEQAAPADIFISADLKWMDELASQNLIKTGSRKNITGNTLVIVGAVASNLDATIESLVMTLGDEKIALGDIKSVPAGKYAKAALDSFNLWPSIEPHVVMQDNVRSALALVANGEAKLGIVYGSDASAEPKVKVLTTFPESSHPKIIYPAAIVATSTNIDNQAYLDFLTSSEAQLIFKKNGFKLLE